MYADRIRLPSLLNKVMSPTEAAALIQDGMTVGMSGFTRAGEAKLVPQALAERAKLSPSEDQPDDGRQPGQRPGQDN